MRRKNRRGFETVEHTAELGLRIRGRTWREFFENAAKGLAFLQGAPGLLTQGQKRRIQVSASTPEEVLVSWLNELIFLTNSRGRSLSRVVLREGKEANIEAEVFLDKRRAQGREIKAATYHGLEIRKTARGYSGTVILDV